eukprot:1212878-Pyramimonas_sp.AAC.1
MADFESGLEGTLRATWWTLRTMVWMLRDTWWTLRAILWMLRATWWTLMADFESGLGVCLGVLPAVCWACKLAIFGAQVPRLGCGSYIPSSLL